MLVFVIPLRNPETSQDWKRCNSLCQQTVRSALAQVDRDVRVIVACRDFAPDLTDERLTVLRRPYGTPERTWEDQHKDKYLKIADALIEARKYAPCYIMKLDADDLVDWNLSSVVHRTGYKPGYYIPRGYHWLEGSKLIRPVDNFHLVCGSSNILWCEEDELPSSPDDDMSAFPVMRLGHNIAVSAFEAQGTPLMPIAERSAIYRVAHGENITAHLERAGAVHNKPNWKFHVGQALRLVELRPFTRNLRRSFFGYDLPT